MIEYLNIEIVPVHFADTEDKELRIKIKTSRNPVLEKRQICSPNELCSFFDQIFACAKKEILEVLQAVKP